MTMIGTMEERRQQKWVWESYSYHHKYHHHYHHYCNELVGVVELVDSDDEDYS